jgi:pimeloyl-ACP methyl ester carboxylesterase
MSAAYGSSGAEYTVIDGAGHLPMVEKPEKFAEVVTKFLA